MIILAVGMPRAGSGWHYNLVYDLMRTGGAVEARHIRKRYHLESILTAVNCNIGVLSLRRLAMVMVPSLLGNTFTLKVHSGPTRTARWLIQRGHLRPTYIYRDPRDALLSAYEYGQRGIQSGRKNAFSHLASLDRAIDFITPYVDFWTQWQTIPQCHCLRYEDFRDRYNAEVDRLVDFLGLDPDLPATAEVIAKYRPEQAGPEDRGLHFVRGVTGRYREHLSPAQQRRCLDLFGDRLEVMGYTL
jgi:hypothetical protein